MSSHIYSSEQQHSANPDTPPPEYSVHVPTHQDSPSSRHSPVNAVPGHYPYREQSMFSSGSGPHFASPLPFGPTPITQSQPTLGLSYYDSRSPYSVEAATSRAKRRFIGATFWAISLITCLLLLGAFGRVSSANLNHSFQHTWSFGTMHRRVLGGNGLVSDKFDLRQSIPRKSE